LPIATTQLRVGNAPDVVLCPVENRCDIVSRHRHPQQSIQVDLEHDDPATLGVKGLASFATTNANGAGPFFRGWARANSRCCS
jgi:hypothetical protein